MDFDPRLACYNEAMAATDLITIDPEILGGTPVFAGTRVPVKTLFEYLEANYSKEGDHDKKRIRYTLLH